jgi:hypothetical protein
MKKSRKIKLVSDWKDCWKWFSTNCMLVSVAIQATWLNVPEDLKSSLPECLITIVTIVFLVLGFVGRLVHQDTKNDK